MSACVKESEKAVRKIMKYTCTKAIIIMRCISLN